jgi:amino-acid N-acetyltransferase
MVAMRDTEEMQAVMRSIAEMAAESDPAASDPAAAAAAAAGSLAALPDLKEGLSRDRCIYRRGRPEDTGQLASLIVTGELPPFFLEPYIDGFLVVEYDGRLVAAGGLEFYGDDAVIRSVVVDPAARGLGLGLDVARLLEEDAIASGASDVYLFTLHAWEFWKRLGYVDLPLDQWPDMVRENWQYQFVADYPEASRDVHPMIRARFGSPVA